MTISIDWAGTKRIFVPRADMPIVQASPEIRELDVDSFRLALKDLEASTEGMPWPDTHRHVTETTLSGFVYARSVEILAPYTVEFEDGQYSVRAFGANHNVLDVKINNQVSLAVQNSAGLIVISGGGGGGGTDWTATERNQIRGALGIVGTQAAPAGGGHLQDIRMPVQANLDATVSSRATPGAAMTLTSGERGAVADAVWDEAIAGHLGAGSVGERLDEGATAAEGAAAAGDAMTLTGGERSAIVDAVWDEALAGHLSSGTTGKRLDDAVTVVATELDARALTQLRVQLLDTISADTILARKIAANRLEIDFSLQQLVLYDDNGTTVLKRWPLDTDGGENVSTNEGVQTKRGAAL